MARRIVLTHTGRPKVVGGPRRTLVDLTGQVFGSLKVLYLYESSGTTGHSHTRWICACLACGEKEHPVRASLLRSGGATTCGCSHLRHGLSRSSEYQVFKAMHDRCRNSHNPQFKDYGGRGICVCDRWSGKAGFAAFIADMGQKPPAAHSIDRIDNDGDYEPSNVRWSTRSEQQRNRRTNRLLTFKGQTMCVSEWSECLGIHHALIRSRLHNGWSTEDALTLPRHSHRRHVKTR